MSSDAGVRGALDSDTWRRIGAVLDRLSSVDPRARPAALADACRAEGLRAEDVEPFMAAEHRSDDFLERMDATLLKDVLHDLDAGVVPQRFEAGDRLGPYEIVLAIGAGGMGEVYEARDTRLDRTVAIKLLTAALAERPDARHRFEREARAISALNHPHVCTLYDVSHENGIDFLVMELVDGETLATRLRRGPLPLDEALRYGAQIADALGVAHRTGIVHRDLKPANIMLTRRGVKLLDFGLAALRTPRHALEGAVGPTVTVQGNVVGTLAYMAPEQLQGTAVDTRADVFAFGAVLYEMLTGRRVFEAESSAGVIAAVLARDPEPISKLRLDVPPALEWVVRSCLTKDAERRWENAGDLARQLEWIANAPKTADGSPGRRSWRAIGWAATAVVVVGTAAGLTWNRWRSDAARATPPALARFALYPPDGHEYNRMHSLSPDGRRLAFVAGDGRRPQALWTRAIDALTPQRLVGTEDATYPFWSPDGRFIAFFASGTLKKVELATGAVETICNCETGAGGSGTWNRDGVILFSKGMVVSPLWRVPASGGTPVAITPMQQGDGPDVERVGGNTWPQFLPDGRHFLWLTGGIPRAGLYLGRLDSADRKLLLEFPPGFGGDAADRSRGWYAGGYLFFVHQQALMAQRFSLERLELTGEPIRVVEQVEQTAPGRSFFDVAPGVLAYRAPREGRTIARLAWLDRTGRETGTVGEPMPYVGVALSKDGRYILASTGPTGLVRVEAASGIPTPIGLQGASPVWAADGTRFVFAGGRRRGAAPFPSIASIANPEDFKRFGSDLLGGQAWPTDWSSDGRYVVGQVLYAETQLDVWAADVSTTPITMRYLTRARGDQQDQRISPDGRWVAYASDDRSTTFEVYVRPFPEGARVWRVSTSGGRLPAWTADGRELLYVAPDGSLMSAAVTTGAEFSTSVPQRLFQHEALRRGFMRDQLQGRPYDVVDGRRILLGIPVSDPPPAPIVVVLNWEQLLNGVQQR